MHPTGNFLVDIEDMKAPEFNLHTFLLVVRIGLSRWWIALIVLLTFCGGFAAWQFWMVWSKQTQAIILSLFFAFEGFSIGVNLCLKTQKEELAKELLRKMEEAEK